MLKSTEKVLGIHYVLKNKDLNKLDKNILDFHLTLLLYPVKDESFFDDFIKDFKKEFAKISVLKIPLTIKNIEKKGNFISFKIKNNKLNMFHRKLLKLAWKYQKNYIRTKDLKRIESDYFNTTELENINKYGFAFNGNLYNPHISIKNTNIPDNFKTELILNTIEIIVHHENITKNKIYRREIIKL